MFQPLSQPDVVIGVASEGHFLYLVILCFERRYPKQNSVIPLKSNILTPQICLPPKLLSWLRHWPWFWHKSRLYRQRCTWTENFKFKRQRWDFWEGFTVGHLATKCAAVKFIKTWMSSHFTVLKDPS